MIYLMRHGQTDWNLTKRLQGQTDIPLNETGRLMAEEASLKFGDIPVDICYCSPLCRARETAELFLKGKKVEIISDDRLKEMSFGVLEGATGYREDPECEAYPLFHTPESYLGVEGGETIDQLNERTGAFLREVAIPESNQGKTVLIVAHGGVNCSLCSQVRGIPKNDFWKPLMKNCQLERIV